MDSLLEKVKSNLIITHGEDDELLRGFLLSAIGYAEGYQKRKYRKGNIPPTTEQAIIMLASHLYESRDGSTAGFFSGHAGATQQVWDAVNRLLAMGKRWQV